MKRAWFCAGLVLGVTALLAAQDQPAPTSNTASSQEVSANRSPEQILAAQKELKRRGYFVGGLDGIMGPKTRRAIRRFQGVEGLPQTETLDSATMRKLNVSETGTTAASSKSAQGSNAKTSEQTPSQGGAVAQPPPSPSTPK